MSSTIHKLLNPQHFAKALTDAGVFTEDEMLEVERLVIVAEPQSLVTIYVQKVVDERILDIAALLARAEIVYAEREEPDASPGPGD